MLLCPERIRAAPLYQATLCCTVGIVGNDETWPTAAVGEKCINNSEKYNRDKTDEWVTIRIILKIEDGWKLQKYFCFGHRYRCFPSFKSLYLHYSPCIWIKPRESNSEVVSLFRKRKKGQKHFAHFACVFKYKTVLFCFFQYRGEFWV